MSIIAKLFVDISYSLASAKSYQRVKGFFHSLLDDQNYKYKKYFDYFMMIIILSSVILLVRNVKYPLPDFAVIYNRYFITSIFLSEYTLRFWMYNSISKDIIHQYEKDELLNRKFRFGHVLFKILKKKFKYITSFYAVIDLLAIMPFFHELRILRLFILFRAFKIFRYTKSLQQFAQILASKKFEFFTLMVFTATMISVSSILIYIAEANNENSAIDTLFEAFYWSFVTLSTVGYGDFVPVTDLGRSVAMIIIISGIAVISFTTSIVVSAFTEQLGGIKEQKTISDISKIKHFYLVCGYSNVSKIVCNRLEQNKQKFVVMENDIDKMTEASKLYNHVVLSDPSKKDSYKKYGIKLNEQVISVLCLEKDDVQNIYTALTIRSIDSDVKVLSYLHESKNRKKLSLAGVDNIIYPQELVGVVAKEFIGRPVAFEAIHVLRSIDTDTHMSEILVNERILKYRKYVKDLNVENEKLIFLGVFRNKKFDFNPNENYELQNNDILVVIGLNIVVEEYSINLHKGLL